MNLLLRPNPAEAVRTSRPDRQAVLAPIKNSLCWIIPRLPILATAWRSCAPNWTWPGAIGGNRF